MKILLIFFFLNKIICLINGQNNSEVFKKTKRFIVILDLSHGFNSLKLDVLKSDLIDFINQMNEIEEEVNLTLMTISQELKIIDTKNFQDKTKLLRDINGLEPNTGKNQPKMLKICLELARWLIKSEKCENNIVVLVSIADYKIDELISYRKIINRLRNSANMVILNNPVLETLNSKILVSNEQNYVSSFAELWEKSL